MGRRIPLSDDSSLVNPVLSLSLFAIGMAATMAIITGLCGVRFRRKSSPKPSSSSPTMVTTSATTNEDNNIEDGVAAAETQPPPHTAEDSEDLTIEDETKELPLPPAMKALRESHSCINMTKSQSTRKIDKIMSLKVARTMSMKLQNHLHDEKHQRKKGKLNSENSLWTKTIILGEKCKVPDEEDQDTVIYDKKGNRISTYHKKTTSSMSISLSRQTSCIDPTAIPSQDKDKGIIRKVDDDPDSSDDDDDH